MDVIAGRSVPDRDPVELSALVEHLLDSPLAHPDRNCRDLPVDWFVPTGSGWSPDRGLAACDGCPILTACREFAAETDSVGVWGGVAFPSDKSRRARKIRGLGSLPAHGSWGRWRVGCRCAECRDENNALARAFEGIGRRWLKHGQSGYTHGCRCFTCREAHRMYQAEWRARRRGA